MSNYISTSAEEKVPLKLKKEGKLPLKLKTEQKTDQPLSIKPNLYHFSDGSCVSASFQHISDVTEVQIFEPSSKNLVHMDDKYLEVQLPNKIQLELQLDRYGDKYSEAIVFEKGTLLRSFLKTIIDFYNAPLDETQKKEIVNDEYDDCFDYAVDAKEKILKNEVVYRYELMGDCMFYQGIHKDKNKKDTYYISLGS